MGEGGKRESDAGACNNFCPARDKNCRGSIRPAGEGGGRSSGQFAFVGKAAKVDFPGGRGEGKGGIAGVPGQGSDFRIKGEGQKRGGMAFRPPDISHGVGAAGGEKVASVLEGEAGDAVDVGVEDERFGAFWARARAVPDGGGGAAGGGEKAAGVVPGKSGDFGFVAAHLEILIGGQVPDVNGGGLVAGGDDGSVWAPSDGQAGAGPIQGSLRGGRSDVPDDRTTVSGGNQALAVGRPGDVGDSSRVRAPGVNGGEVRSE